MNVNNILSGYEPRKRLDFDDTGISLTNCNELNCTDNANMRCSNEIEVVDNEIRDSSDDDVEMTDRVSTDQLGNDDVEMTDRVSTDQLGNDGNLHIYNETEESNKEDNLVDFVSMNPSDSIEDIHGRISKELIPKKGMEFDTVVAAHNSYQAYAKEAGFGVRWDRSCKRKGPDKKPIVPHVILDQTFVCIREGERPLDKRAAKVKKPQALTRCKCLAHMKISKRQSDKYQITKFEPVHNHVCVTPSNHSHRKITEAQKAEIIMTRSCGIAPSEKMELMAKQVGGIENLGYTYTDCKIYLRSKRMLDMSVGDTGGVLEYLQKKKKKAEDPDFFSAIQVDEDGLITNILWADAKMRFDYLLFGDAVIFDTTYRKHKDGHPIALFVGVNHHKQTTIFAAALLYDETIPTFTWLFNTFANHAMSGKKPKTIITDQDAAMKSAILSCWGGETVHRLCVWHINKNAAIHLGHIFGKFPDFKKDLSFCMYHYENEDTFVSGWNEMIEKYDLKDNEWLKNLFDIRDKGLLCMDVKLYP